MNLIDDKERLKEYGIRNRKNIFTEIEKNKESYWHDEVEASRIMEYNFDSPIEMQNLLNQYFEEELCTIITVSSFKCKKMHDTKTVKELSDSKEKDLLPDFVYAF